MDDSLSEGSYSTIPFGNIAQCADMLPMILWVGDSTGSITYMNRYWQEHTGLTADVLIDKGWGMAIHPEDIEIFLSEWKNAVRSERPFVLEARLHMADGTYHRHYFSCWPLQETFKGNTDTMFAGTCVNIDKQLRPHNEHVKHTSKKRILLVEDHKGTRVLMSHMLKVNYDVKLTSNAREATELALKHTFDLALIDINLGDGTDGIMLLNKLRTLPRFQHIPIGAVTAYAMPGDREQFLKAGFSAYLKKPFSSEDLLTFVHGMLELQPAINGRITTK